MDIPEQNVIVAESPALFRVIQQHVTKPIMKLIIDAAMAMIMNANQHRIKSVKKRKLLSIPF